MCNFLSVLILKNGDVRHHPMLDSHADLVRYFKLPDDNVFIQHFAKAELTPVDWLNPDTWTWRVDEAIRPVWLTDAVEQRAERATREIARHMVINHGEHELIVDGCWIVGGDAVVRDVRAGRIVNVRDNARISDVGDTARISGVGGTARISDVGGTAHISGVGDNAQISDVGGNAQISSVWDNAHISDVRGNAQISDVWGNAQISDVWGNAQISDVGDNARMDDSAQAHLVR